MTAGPLAIARLGAAADGPRRLRGHLERATRPTRVAARTDAPLAGVASALPRAGLRQALDEHLRAALGAGQGPPSVAAPARGRLAADGGVRAFAAKSPREAVARPRAERRAAPDDPGAGAPELEWPEASAAWPPPGARRAEAATTSGTGGRSRTPAGSPARRRARPGWETARSGAAPPRDGSLATAPPQRPVAPTWPADAAVQRPTAMDAPGVAAALRAFAAGEPLPEAARSAAPRGAAPDPPAWTAGDALAPARPPQLPARPARPAPPAPASPDRSGPPRPGVAGGASSRAAALRHLADDVAEILRDQAISHGIDVP